MYCACEIITKVSGEYTPNGLPMTVQEGEYALIPERVLKNVRVRYAKPNTSGLFSEVNVLREGSIDKMQQYLSEDEHTLITE